MGFGSRVRASSSLLHVCTLWSADCKDSSSPGEVPFLANHRRHKGQVQSHKHVSSLICVTSANILWPKKVMQLNPKPMGEENVLIPKEEGKEK